MTKEHERAINKFHKLRDSWWIFCPILDCKVRFTTKNFKHLIYKDWKHKRSSQEIKMRSICFLSVEKIIKKSHTYQEFLVEEWMVKIKKHWKKIKEKRIVSYYWLVAVVQNRQWSHRIRVVIKKSEWFEHAEYLSVMPAWNSKGYKNFMWEKI